MLIRPRTIPATLPALLGVLLVIPATALAQSTASGLPGDYTIVAAEPDAGLTHLPTSLRMPPGRLAFRMTHRFTRPIEAGSAWVEDLFGFDSAARVSLEFRVGVAPDTQLIVHRGNNRTIQLSAQHQALRTSSSRLRIDLVAAAEGRNNFREDHGLTTGAIISVRDAERGALYAHPLLVLRSRPDTAGAAGDSYTALLGLGGRLRLGQSRVALVAEVAPRLAGYAPRAAHVAVGIERRSRGHLFQLSVANGFGSTLRQIAHGGTHTGDWYLGFNLTRRFY